MFVTDQNPSNLCILMFKFYIAKSGWNELPVELRDLTVGPATFAKHLKTHLFRVGFFLIEHALLSLCNIL